MHTARNGHCCAVLDGMLYVIGGFDAESKPLASVEKYDQAKDEWTIVESLNIARGNAAVAVMNGALYVAGGQSNGLEASVECYHPGKNEWFTIYSMAENRSQFGLTELNGYLYAIGGLSRNIERYDPCTNSWSTVSKERHHCGDCHRRLPFFRLHPSIRFVLVLACRVTERS